jgi:hypothetical protein
VREGPLLLSSVRDLTAVHAGKGLAGTATPFLSWSERKGISGAAKCFCVKTGVIGLEWKYKLTACFARYVEIVSEVAGDDY